MNILLTGADRGLGLGTAKRLLTLGHTVYAGQYLTGWTELDVLKIEFPDTLFPIPLDISDSSSVADAASLVTKQTCVLDMIINNAGIAGRNIPRTGEPPEPVVEKPVPESPDEGLRQDFDMMLRVYNTNSLGAIRVVEAFLPLLKNSPVKRLCFVSSEAGSVERAQRTEMFGYCMSKAALNMYVKILHNRLHPLGYGFRLYHPGWVMSYMRGVKSENGDFDVFEAGTYAADFYLSNAIDENTLQLIDFKGEVWPF